MRDFLWRASRWLLFVILLGLAILFLFKIYQVAGPKVRDVNEKLPEVFRATEGAFWSWIVGSLAVAGGTGYWIFRRRRAHRLDPAVPESGGTEPVDPALATSWEAVAGLRHRRPSDPVFLAIAPGDEPLDLLLAAGLPPDGEAPDPPAPIRGLSTEEGLFVVCSGASGEAARFACRASWGPADGAPSLRGIVVVAPVATILGPEARGFASGVRAGLRAVVGASETRCPVFVVVTGMEDVPGFLEYARRMPPDYRTMNRFGFSLPGGPEPSHAGIAREFDRFVAWYARSLLRLLAADPLEQAGNEGLFGLSGWLTRARRPVLDLLEAASVGIDDDPPDLLGCYFAATGEGPEARAFAEAVIRGKVVGDPRSARWSRRAVESDGRLRRVAIVLGIAGASLAAASWAGIMIGLRPSLGVAQTLLAGLVIGWAVTWWLLLRPRPAG